MITQLTAIALVLAAATLPDIVHCGGGRRKTTDSIMDIMNTRHIERTLAERRQNASRAAAAEEKRMLFSSQNDLDEDSSTVTDSDPPDLYGDGGGSQPAEMTINFELNGRPVPPNRPIDLLMRYNDTGAYGGGGGGAAAAAGGSQPQIDPELLADLQSSFRTDKLLKSSKNALYVTRKEYLKKDWCKTEPLVQRIREDGCLTRNIINRFCYGQCNSFYIPKSPKRSGGSGGGSGGGGGRSKRLKRLWNSLDEFEPEDLTGAAFRSCAFCKPKKFTWMTVTLRCPSMVPQLRRKKIQRIKQCKCMAEPVN